jgi:hypothetical protein
MKSARGRPSGRRIEPSIIGTLAGDDDAVIAYGKRRCSLELERQERDGILHVACIEALTLLRKLLLHDRAALVGPAALA